MLMVGQRNCELGRQEFYRVTKARINKGISKARNTSRVYLLAEKYSAHSCRLAKLLEQSATAFDVFVFITELKC